VQNATVDDVSVEPFTYQVGFFAAPTRAGVSVTSGLTLRNYRTNGTHADGINLHGAHRDIVVENCTIENSRDDGYGLWSIGTLATNITFRSNTAAKTSGACFAAYGGAFSAFQNNTASDCPRGAVVLFGYGGTNPDVHDTCFGGVFSNTSSTLVAGNHGGGGSRGASRPCLVFNQHSVHAGNGALRQWIHSGKSNLNASQVPLLVPVTVRLIALNCRQQNLKLLVLKDQ
jgi:hypothetical protein